MPYKKLFCHDIHQIFDAWLATRIRQPRIGHLAIGFPVFKSLLHEMQYSPRSSWHVIVDPTWHQGQRTTLGCLAYRMFHHLPGDRLAWPATMTMHMDRFRDI